MQKVAKIQKLIPADDADIFHVRSFFGVENHADICEKLKDGRLKAVAVEIDGVTKYLVCWFKDFNSRLHIALAIERNGGGNFPALLAAVKQIARQNACFGITCLTDRPGLAGLLLKNGFKNFHALSMDF